MSSFTLPHRPSHSRIPDSTPHTTTPTRQSLRAAYEQQQAAVGSSLFLGGVVVTGLFALLVWKGLF
ncbi:MAG: hypothetical protein ABI083_16610 [Lapillicoccus sp.]